MSVTLAEVLAEHWESYAAAYRSRLSAAHYRAVRCAVACRTPAMGGRLYRCGDCKKHHYAYHSCNHRSCPQCGASDQKMWCAKQEAKLLPTAYFMVTFTLPDTLRYLCLAHPNILYNLMLKESAGALTDVIATKYQGGRIGLISVLHTWGRQMQHHPHIHCIVPGVVFDEANCQLKHPKKKDFLVSFRPVADRFRSRIYTALKDNHPDIFEKLTPEARKSLLPKQQWNVNFQHVGRGVTALRYLARYVQRSAFTPKRIIGYNKAGKLILRCTCSNTGKSFKIALSPHEFIRRWLIHVLPKGFPRVRHNGFLGSAAKKTRLKVRLLLGELGEPDPDLPVAEPFKCNHCGGELVFTRKIPRLNAFYSRGPPTT